MVTVKDGGLQEWGHRPHAAIQSRMLEVFGENMLESVLLRVGPEMRIKPGELIRGGTYKSQPHQAFVRIQDRKLSQELLSLSPRLESREQRIPPIERPAHRGNERDDDLVRQPKGVFYDASPQQLRGNTLFLVEPRPVRQPIVLDWASDRILARGKTRVTAARGSGRARGTGGRAAAARGA